MNTQELFSIIIHEGEFYQNKNNYLEKSDSNINFI